MPEQSPEQPKNHAADQSFMAVVGGTIIDRLKTPTGIVSSLVAGTAILSLAIAGISRGTGEEEQATLEVYEPADTTSEITESLTYGFQDPEEETSTNIPEEPTEDTTSGAPETEAPSLTEEPSPSSTETSAAPLPTPPLSFEGRENDEGDFYNCWMTENDTAKIFTNEGKVPAGFKLALFTVEEIDGEFQPYVYFPEDNGLVYLNEDAERLTSSAILVDSGVEEGVNVTYPQLDDVYNQLLWDNEDLFAQLYGSYREEASTFYDNIASYCPPKEEFN